jgi:DNA adenine methylase
VTPPFLRWVGSKRKLVETLAKHVPTQMDVYSEPFLGSGSLFFHLQSQGRLEGVKVRLSDVNKYLIQTYRAVQQVPETVIRYLEPLLQEHSPETYYKVRDEWNSWWRHLADEGAMQASYFIYLNAANYNGLYRVNKKGDYNVPLGRKRVRIDPGKIRAASVALTGVELLPCGYETAIELARLSSIAKLRCFVYCDPPYLPSADDNSFTSYGPDGFDAESHNELSQCLAGAAARGVRVLASNSLAARDLYSDPIWVTEEVSTAYTVSRNASSRGEVKELLIRSKNLEDGVS